MAAISNLVCPLLSRRQVCNLQSARSDFDAILKLRPSHKSVAKELETLDQLENHVAALNTGGSDSQTTRHALQRIYDAAPDCVTAQLKEAELEMEAGNYEEVGIA